MPIARLHIELSLLCPQFKDRNFQIKPDMLRLLSELPCDDNTAIQIIYPESATTQDDQRVIPLTEHCRHHLLNYTFFENKKSIFFKPYGLIKFRNLDGTEMCLATHPELNHHARQAGCDTLMDQHGVLHPEHYQSALEKLIKSVNRKIIILDFDNTISDQAMTEKLKKPIIFPHIIDALTNMILTLKAKNNLDQLEFKILSTRRPDYMIRPEHRYISLGDALQILINEVHKKTGITITIPTSERHCLGGVKEEPHDVIECNAFVRKSTNTTLGVVNRLRSMTSEAFTLVSWTHRQRILEQERIPFADLECVYVDPLKAHYFHRHLRSRIGEHDTVIFIDDNDAQIAGFRYLPEGKSVHPIQVHTPHHAHIPRAFHWRNHVLTIYAENIARETLTVATEAPRLPPAYRFFSSFRSASTSRFAVTLRNIIANNNSGNSAANPNPQ